MSSQTVNKYEVPLWRILFIYGLIVSSVGVMVYRLVGLQVVGPQTWMKQAADNYQKTISDPAPRGIIYDRNGYVLARNIASYNVVITPADLPDDEADIQRVYREVSEMTGIPAGGPVTEETLNNAKLFSACIPGPSIADMVALGESLAPYTPVKIACNINEELARVIREKSVDWPGVSVEIEPIRDYPTGSVTADIVGFLGPIPAALESAYQDRGYVSNRDKIGYSGVEDSLNDILLGKNGVRVVQRDVAGQVLRNLEPPKLPVAGNNVVLTIDTRLQKAAEAALIDEINYWNTYFGTMRISSGVVIAMNPKTGEILAMVSYPTFENNRMARFIPGYYYDQLSKDPRRPLVNNAISGEFPPGSTFKLSTATGAFNEGVIAPGKIVQTPGKLVLCERFRPTDPCTDRNSRPFVDWIYDRNGVINETGFGALDFFHCIAYSSNVCFYKLGGGYKDEIPEGLGINRLGEYARALGYGARSGLELPGEEDGLIPDPKWKRINTTENWSTGDTYIASVGQGYVLGTPLQVLLSGATVANHGKLMQPTVVREIQDDEGRVIPVWFNPKDFSLYELSQVADPEGKTKNMWVNPADPNHPLPQPPEGSYQISPFTPNLKWDITREARINEWTCESGYCEQTGRKKTVLSTTVDAVRTGTRMAVTEDPLGTLHKVFTKDYPLPIAVAGKTGTAEYCDDVASKLQQCQFGSWPTHAWTLAYAPFDDPEIIILAFAYHGGEGGTVAAPIVARVMQAYFELKSIDLAKSAGS
ncbi:MAG TPA: penicillin-binding transpeptidase domain-containing protein [Anaerolineales bacterium]|nr:penicillin-binding transpeptidase domain-containing protein [Anaerolineales bacterium]HLO32944.1 penicillin-binding transpeptidase domain-containing protein [Anaerolineales bacterium]